MLSSAIRASSRPPRRRAQQLGHAFTSVGRTEKRFFVRRRRSSGSSNCRARHRPRRRGSAPRRESGRARAPRRPSARRRTASVPAATTNTASSTHGRQQLGVRQQADRRRVDDDPVEHAGGLVEDLQHPARRQCRPSGPRSGDRPAAPTAAARSAPSAGAAPPSPPAHPRARTMLSKPKAWWTVGPPQIGVDEQHAAPVRLAERQREVDGGEGLALLGQGAAPPGSPSARVPPARDAGWPPDAGTVRAPPGSRWSATTVFSSTSSAKGCEQAGWNLGDLLRCRSRPRAVRGGRAELSRSSARTDRRRRLPE